MATPQITVAGNLSDLFGTTTTAATLVVQLCNYQSQVPRVYGTALIAQTAPLPLSFSGGTYTFKVWGNDVITPTGTFYTVKVVDANGNTVQINSYQFIGTETVDLSTQPLYEPGGDGISVLTNPPGQALQVIDGSIFVEGALYSAWTQLTPIAGALTIPCASGSKFYIVLTANITSVVFVEPEAGQEFQLLFMQDTTGSHTVTYPASVLNPTTPVNPVATGKTLQRLSCLPDLTLMAPGYYP